MQDSSDEATYMASTADTTNVLVLGDTNKEVLTNAVALRTYIEEATAKFTANDYIFTDYYTETTTIDLTTDNLSSVELGKSVSTLTLENKSVTVTPATSTEVFDTVYMTFANEKVTLTTLVMVGSKTVTA